MNPFAATPEVVPRHLRLPARSRPNLPSAAAQRPRPWSTLTAEPFFSSEAAAAWRNLRPMFWNNGNQREKKRDIDTRW
jgi:hypothetical protein